MLEEVFTLQKRTSTLPRQSSGRTRSRAKPAAREAAAGGSARDPPRRLPVLLQRRCPRCTAPGRDLRGQGPSALAVIRKRELLVATTSLRSPQFLLEACSVPELFLLSNWLFQFRDKWLMESLQKKKKIVTISAVHHVGVAQRNGLHQGLRAGQAYSSAVKATCHFRYQDSLYVTYSDLQQ